MKGHSEKRFLKLESKLDSHFSKMMISADQPSSYDITASEKDNMQEVINQISAKQAKLDEQMRAN